MKLLRYGAPGAERPGLLDPEGGLRDLSAHVPDIGPDQLSPDALASLAALDPAALPPVPGAPRLGPPLSGTRKFLCVGLNYADHAAETGKQPPEEPVLFAKAVSAICGPNDDVQIPRGADRTDWEAELGVVIGTRAKYVEEADALPHVAGYVLVNDVSERRFQSERGGQWTKGKSHDTFGPVGPWLVTRDEIPDPQALSLRLSVDGVPRQDGSTATMIFGVARLVSYISRFMTLEPGDLIATGTPPGVGLGMTPPTFLREGQVVALSADGLGAQRQRMVAA